MQVTVLFFGRLRELIGYPEDRCTVPRATTIEELFARYSQRGLPELEKLRGCVVPSLNQEFAAWDTRIQAGDEVGFLPPVSGG